MAEYSKHGLMINDVPTDGNRGPARGIKKWERIT